MRRGVILLAVVLICGTFIGAGQPTTAPVGYKVATDGFVVVVESYEVPAAGGNVRDKKAPKPAGKPLWSIEAMAMPNHEFLSRSMVPEATTELSGSLRENGDGKTCRGTADDLKKLVAQFKF